MKRKIDSRTIGLGFAFACILIAWIGLATYWTTHQLVRSFDSVSESHQAIEKLQSIQGLLEAESTSAYSYVITGRQDRLITYRNANTRIPHKLRDVESLLKSHPRQKKALRQFHQLFTLHQQYLSKILAVRQNEGFEAASAWVSAEDDRSIGEGLNDLLEGIQKEENKLLKQQSASTTEHSSQTTLALAGAAGVSLILIGWVFGLLRRATGERRVAENTNQRLETFLRSIVERIPYMVLVKEATNLRLTLVNKAATEWLGHSEEELLGSNDTDLRPHQAAHLDMQQDREALQKGEPIDIPEERLIREGKDERILHTQKVAIPDEEGDPAFLLTISEDITRRKQEQRMLELSRDTAVQSERLKSEFIRNMSHEIRTPLSVIIGMMTILLDTDLSSEQRGFATKVSDAAGGLAKITKGILDFSRIEAGTFALEMKDMNLRQNIDGILTMLKEQAKTKGVALVSLIPPTIPHQLIGDPIRLRQVLTELIGNALKFTPRGEIIVRVSESETEQNDGQLWLTIKVSDTGPGIDEEVQKHLFEPFRQGDGSRTRRFGGTGLGLAISKRIVELMGGTIGVSSALNQGTTLWCTVPFRKLGEQNLHVKSTSLPWARARILVVDENEISRQQLRQQLGSWGVASEGTSNGETALDCLRREKKAGRPFPIVLCDLHLSDMEGVAFSRAIKGDAVIASTRVLVLTESPIDPSTASSLGFDAWISKPPKPNALYDRLAGLIESGNQEHQSAA